MNVGVDNNVRKVRAFFRLLEVVLATVVSYTLLQFGRLLTLPFRRRRQRWRTFIFRLWARWLARIMHMQIQVEGQPPRPPFFLVTNHLSYIDILVLASQLDCLFVSRHDVADWPVLGHLITVMRTIYIDRNRRRDIPRVLNQLARVYADGEGVVVFAEGGSSAGARVQPMKPSLLELAVQSHLPVSYASISYRTPPDTVPAYLAVCWWGDMTFVGHYLSLLQLPEFHATLRFGDQTVQATDRKELAQKLHALISAIFTPVVSDELLAATGGKPNVPEQSTE